jgi:hypothetical protein
MSGSLTEDDTGQGELDLLEANKKFSTVCLPK